MMWGAVWCAVVLACGASVAAVPAPDTFASLPQIDLAQIDQSAPDDENFGYASPSAGGRYAGASEPWLYLLADAPRDSQLMKVRSSVAMQERSRRGFSVNPAVEVLQRGAYNNYIERLMQNNRDFLNCVGKRDSWENTDCKLKN